MRQRCPQCVPLCPFACCFSVSSCLSSAVFHRSSAPSSSFLLPPRHTHRRAVATMPAMSELCMHLHRAVSSMRRAHTAPVERLMHA